MWQQETPCNSATCMEASFREHQGPWLLSCFQFRLLLFLPKRTESDHFCCSNFTEKMESRIRTKEALAYLIMPWEYTIYNRHSMNTLEKN